MFYLMKIEVFAFILLASTFLLSWMKLDLKVMIFVGLGFQIGVLFMFVIIRFDELGFLSLSCRLLFLLRLTVYRRLRD